MEEKTEINFQNVSDAFTKQSSIYDDLEKDNIILQLMRKKVRDHVLSFLNINDKILELNAGTGLDAVFFANKGFNVHAIDISDGMINKLAEKISLNNLQDKISVEKLSFTNLDQIKNRKFDYIFSNFGGLNCVNDVRLITKHFKDILNPGGKVTLVIMPRICPWEAALIFRGHFKSAFRRFHKNGTISNIEGKKFLSYYHSPKKVLNSFKKDFKKTKLIGLNSLTPPPYMKNFPSRYPKTFNLLNKIDNKISHVFPFNIFADHFIITLKYL